MILSADIAGTHSIKANIAVFHARIDTLIRDGRDDARETQARVEANRQGIEANRQEIKRLREDLTRHGNRLIRIEELLLNSN